MTVVRCPICDWRVCDSNKSPQIEKLSSINIKKADIVIKCKNCKCCLALKLYHENNDLYKDSRC